MKKNISRRVFVKAAGAAAAGMGVLGLRASLSGGEPAAKGAPHAEQLGWRLGCQAYTFRLFSFQQAVEKTASLGLHFIEAFPGQKLGAADPQGVFGEGMSAKSRADVKKMVADHGLKLVNFGVVGLSVKEPSSRRIFDFAKDMGLETIVSEPDPAAFDMLDKLCEEYQINVALHNHPEPSRYWNPDTVVHACKGHSKRIGACCDTGHWMRSGINPLDARQEAGRADHLLPFQGLGQVRPRRPRCPLGHRQGGHSGDAQGGPASGPQARLLDRIRVSLGRFAAGFDQVRGLLRQSGRRAGRLSFP